MAYLVYIDETGSVGRGARDQELLQLAAVMVDERQVQPLAERFRRVGWDHLGWLPDDLELHGNEIWGGAGYWSEMSPEQLIAVYEQALSALEKLDLYVAHASIHKQRLHDRYAGGADGNAYLLALQFLLEKIDANWPSSLKILVADEAKEHQFRAIKMVAELQDWAGGGVVPGRQLRTVIDSMHFVSSHASPGVQMADLVAYALQRYQHHRDRHPNAQAAIARIVSKIGERTATWREPWPSAR